MAKHTDTERSDEPVSEKPACPQDASRRMDGKLSNPQKLSTQQKTNIGLKKVLF
jgi:hypothetical protein